MKIIEKVKDDFRHGENIENYLILALAFLIILLDFFGLENVFGLENDEWISEVTLAILALLAFGRILDRKKLDDIRLTLASHSSKEPFLKNSDYHANRPRIRNARTLDFMGLALSRTISIYEYEFIECLKNGGKVRLLIVDPDSTVPESLALMGYSKGAKEQILSNLSATVAIAKSWQETMPQCEVELRYLAGFPPFRMAVFDKEEVDGYATVRLFVLSQSEEIPMNVIRASENKEWFALFVDQFERHWDMARSSSITK